MPSNQMPLLHFQLLPKEHIARAYEIEIAEYPADEAASLENLVYRHTHAPHLFMGCYLIGPPPQDNDDNDDNVHSNRHTTKSHPPQASAATTAATATATTAIAPTQDQLIGYIVSTQAQGKTLTHHSMSHHDPAGDSVCIHSVCIARAYQRRGFALRMLRAYLAYLEQKDFVLTAEETSKARLDSLQRVLLIAHDPLVPLYKKAGFEWVGQSNVTHGPDPWFEMKYEI